MDNLPPVHPGTDGGDQSLATVFGQNSERRRHCIQILLFRFVDVDDVDPVDTQKFEAGVKTAFNAVGA